MPQTNMAIGDIMSRLWPLLISLTPVYLFLTFLSHCYEIAQAALSGIAAAFGALIPLTVVFWGTIAFLSFHIFIFPFLFASEAVTPYLRSNVMAAFSRLRMFRRRPPPNAARPQESPTQPSAPVPLTQASPTPSASQPETPAPGAQAPVGTPPCISQSPSSQAQPTAPATTPPEVPEAPGPDTAALGPAVATVPPIKTGDEDDEEYDAFDADGLQAMSSPNRPRLLPLFVSTPLDRSSQARPESPTSPIRLRMPARTLDQFSSHPNEQGLLIGDEIISPPPLRPRRASVPPLQHATRAQRTRAHVLPLTPIAETTIETVPVSEEETALLTSMEEGQSRSTFTSQDSAASVRVVERDLEDNDEAEDDANKDDNATRSSGDSFHTGDTELNHPAAGPVSKPTTAEDETRTEVSDEDEEEDEVSRMARKLPRGPCLCWTHPDTYRLIDTNCDIHRGWYPEQDVNIRALMRVLGYLSLAAKIRRRRVHMLQSALPKPGLLIFDEWGVAAYLTREWEGGLQPRRVSSFPLDAEQREILRKLQEVEYVTQSVKRGFVLPMSLREAQLVAAATKVRSEQYPDIQRGEQYDPTAFGAARTMLAYAREWTAAVAVYASQEPTIATEAPPPPATDPVPTPLTTGQKKKAKYRAKVKRNRQAAATASLDRPGGGPSQSTGSPKHDQAEPVQPPSPAGLQMRPDTGLEEAPSPARDDPILSGESGNPIQVQKEPDQQPSPAEPETGPETNLEEIHSPATVQTTAHAVTSGERQAGPVIGSSPKRDSPNLSACSEPPSSPSLRTPSVSRQSPNPRLSPQPPATPTSPNPPKLHTPPQVHHHPEHEMSPKCEASPIQQQLSGRQKLRTQGTSECQTPSLPSQPPEVDHTAIAQAGPASAGTLAQILPKRSKPRKKSKVGRSKSLPQPQKTSNLEGPTEPQSHVEAEAVREPAVEEVAEESEEQSFAYPNVSATYANVNQEQPKIPSPYGPTVGPLPYIPPGFTYPEIEDCYAVPTVIHRDRSVSFNVTEARVRGMRWTGPSALQWLKVEAGRRRATK